VTITWISRDGLESWAQAVLAKYPRVDIDLFITRLRHVGRSEGNGMLPTGMKHRGIIQ
jgi:hypothetical protein